jgi:mono/diheme cytochrome c family protein
LLGPAAVALATGVAAGAVHGTSAKPKIVGNAAAGKPLFVSTCGICHVMKAAGSAGTAGPNLDRVPLPEPVAIKAITLGGAAVMGQAALAKYSTRMPAYKNVLSTGQIQDIAAYVYRSTHH